MVDDKYIEYLKNTSFSNGTPVEYKLKCGKTINIHPILVENVMDYFWSKQVVDIDKGAINNIEVLQSKYLKFIYKYLIPKDHTYASMLYYLLTLCLKENIVCVIDEEYNCTYDNGKAVVVLVDNFQNNTVTGFITEQEFDDIVKIIKYQNDATYIDRYLSPDVKQAVEEFYSLQSKNTDVVEPTLEKKKAFVTSKTGLLLPQINKLTYRYFVEIYNSCLNSELYIGQKIIQGSYKYDVEKNVVHPMFEKERDPVLEAFGGDAEAFVQKVNSVNG